MLQYRRVVIVGVGLLGGSFGLALRHRGLAESIVGVGRNEATLRQAAARGAITEFSLNLETACKSADLVVIGTPVQSIAEFVRQAFAAQLLPNCLVTDVGSTKLNICQQLSDLSYGRFCGSHPMAGGEKTGVAYASHDLFLGRRTIITPTSNTLAETIQQTDQLWRSLGSDVVRMSPQEHDRAVASVSHLPHLVASALAASTAPELIPLTASGWQDTTRVAAGDVEMWRQIISENREPILSALRGFSDALAGWITAIERDNQEAITALLEKGKSMRDSAL
ncbi:MAG: prephenate dehydrogenase/arogenate dehydrogenase family protein [Pirellulales bacterium]